MLAIRHKFKGFQDNLRIKKSEGDRGTCEGLILLLVFKAIIRSSIVSVNIKASSRRSV